MREYIEYVEKRGEQLGVQAVLLHTESDSMRLRVSYPRKMVDRFYSAAWFAAGTPDTIIHALNADITALAQRVRPTMTMKGDTVDVDSYTLRMRSWSTVARAPSYGYFPIDPEPVNAAEAETKEPLPPEWGEEAP